MKRSLLHAAAALLLASPALAEVSITRLPGGGVELYFEASPTGPWGRVRPDVRTTDMLNPQGDGRSDGWPSLQTNGTTGTPDAVWASSGDESDILFSFHDGGAWREPLNLSSRSGADFGPAISQDAYGNRFVAWNNARSGRTAIVFAGVRRDGLTSTRPEELTARQNEGRRPSLNVHVDGKVYVAYEEQANGNDDVPYIAIDRILPRRDQDSGLHCSGENTIDLGRSVTIRTALLDARMVAAVKVDAEAGHLWVTWIDSRSRVGWVELVEDGVFSSPQYVPYDPAGGDAVARERVRETVLAP